METVCMELLPLEVQVEWIEGQGLATLLYCRNAWALRHRFVQTETGETVRARCGSWSCLYCGPRKVDMWRQLVKAAQPTLFITLTQVGYTLKEAARVLTTVLQYLRRGSRGRGKNHVGARPAYPIQVFAILEEHSDFEGVGFHWHLLVKGIDFIPNQVVSDALRSATGGRSYITKTVRVRNHAAVGYVTKYLMKEIMRERRGLVQEERQRTTVALHPVAGAVDGRGETYQYEVARNEQGDVEVETRVENLERLCKAHRIRYSKHFFPTSTAELRRQVFGEKVEDEQAQEQGQECEQVAIEEQAEPSEPVAQPVKATRSSWILYEVEPVSKDDEGVAGGETAREAHRRRKREALVEAVTALREGKRLYSRRVVSIWSYQREQLRLAG